MIAQEFEYSATNAVERSARADGGWRKPLAGGMSLIPMMKLRLATPEHVVDIRRIEGLQLHQGRWRPRAHRRDGNAS